MVLRMDRTVMFGTALTSASFLSLLTSGRYGRGEEPAPDYP
jgi:hypothetical protein